MQKGGQPKIVLTENKYSAKMAIEKLTGGTFCSSLINMAFKYTQGWKAIESLVYSGLLKRI